MKLKPWQSVDYHSSNPFAPLEIMPRSSAAGLDFRMILAGFNAPLQSLTGFASSGPHL